MTNEVDLTVFAYFASDVARAYYRAQMKLEKWKIAERARCIAKEMNKFKCIGKNKLNLCARLPIHLLSVHEKDSNTYRLLRASSICKFTIDVKVFGLFCANQKYVWLICTKLIPNARNCIFPTSKYTGRWLWKYYYLEKAYNTCSSYFNLPKQGSIQTRKSKFVLWAKYKSTDRTWIRYDACQIILDWRWK